MRQCVIECMRVVKLLAYLYMLLAISVCFAVSNNLLLHGFSNRGLNGMSDVLLFNSMVSCIWFVLLCAYGLISGGLAFTPASVGWGVLYGSVMSLFLLTKMQAMATGPVSVTSFVGCASLLLSTAFGVFALREDASLLQITGVVLLIASLFLTISPKRTDAKPSWKYWCAAFFICSASVGIIFKLHQRSSAAAYIDGMMISASITSTLIFAAAAFTLARLSEKPPPRVPKSAFPYLAACAVASCVYNRLNIMLSGKLPSVVFFPVFNGSVILIAVLAGVFLFGERLKKAQTLGIIIGALALILASGSADGIISIILSK